MKLPDNYKNAPTAGKLNTFLFMGISLMWGHMLSLISLWFLPLTIFCLAVSYGSEIRDNKKPDLVL